MMIERKSRLGGDEFRAQYLRTKTPVLIEQMMEDWPARTLWTKDYLKMVCGDQVVEVMGDRDSDPLFEIHSDAHKTQMPFAAFADLAFSETSSNNVYMVANNRFMLSASGLRLLRDVGPLSAYLNEQDVNGRVFFWFGPEGTVTPLHHDVMDIMLTQVHGRKRIRLFSRDQTPLLYHSIGVFSDVDYERPDFNKYPLYRHARPVEFDLRAGEMLYLPEGHWHQIRSLSPSISVSFTNFRL